MAIQALEVPVNSSSSWRESVAAKYAVVQERIQSRLETAGDAEDYV